MKILAFVNAGSSVAYHRIILPLTLMEGIEVHITNDIHSSYFEGIDIFFYSRVIPEKALESISLLRKKYGFKIGIDVDDYWVLDDLHPFSKDYYSDGFAKRQIKHMQNADFIFTTHERMASAISNVCCSHLYKFNNAIPKTGQYIETEMRPHPEGLTRLFWQGSITHLEDLRLLDIAIKAIKNTGIWRNVEMVLAGYEPENETWNEMANIYTDKARIKHALLTPLHYEGYYNFYSEADICLVPIRVSVFNSKKSNLKILEAANMKLPVIASQVHPYLNMPVRYALKPEQWLKHIVALVTSKNARTEEGQKLHEFCNQYYNFDLINAERKQVLEYYSHK